MEKHTPGPWGFEFGRWTKEAPILGFAITAPGRTPAVASAGISSPHILILAPEYRHANPNHYTEEEVEANARLIAAAPDLLEAAHGVETLYAELQAALPGTVKSGSFRRVTEAVEKARAAIAKATEPETAAVS